MSVSANRFDPETCSLSWHCRNQRQSQISVYWEWKEDIFWNIRSDSININNLTTLFYPLHHFCPTDYESNLRHRRPNESQAHFTDENASFCVCPFHCWHPKEPYDCTVHSWPGQPFYFSCPALSYCSCESVLTMVWHSAEPSCHEERRETVVHLYRWEELMGRSCRCLKITFWSKTEQSMGKRACREF